MSEKDEYDKEVTDFFRRYQGRLRGFLINIGAARDADDIVIFAFMQVRQRWAWLRTQRADLYLHKVALNELHRCRRSAQHMDIRWDPPESPVVDPSTCLIDRLALRWALDQLPSREKEAVILRHYAGLNVAETAAVMGGVNEGTIKRYTSDGLGKLRKLLQDRTGAGEAEAR